MKRQKQPTASTLTGRKPILRRVLDFPLISMVCAALLVDFGFQVAAHVSDGFQQLGRQTVQGLNVGLGIVFAFFIYKLIVRHLGEQPRDDLPLSKTAAQQIAAGSLFGVILFSLVVAAAAALNVYHIVGRGGFQQFAVITIGIAIVPAFSEELLFRGILFRWTEQFAGSWAALALTSAAFGYAHLTNADGSYFASVAITLEAGILLGGLYMLTRSLWASIGWHAGWNFAQGFLFSVPVSGLEEHGLVKAKLAGPLLLSGGKFGLEASLIALVMATPCGLFVAFMALRRGNVVSPWWVRLKPEERVDQSDENQCDHRVAHLDSTQA